VLLLTLNSLVVLGTLWCELASVLSQILATIEMYSVIGTVSFPEEVLGTGQWISL